MKDLYFCGLLIKIETNSVENLSYKESYMGDIYATKTLTG